MAGNLLASPKTVDALPEGCADSDGRALESHCGTNGEGLDGTNNASERLIGKSKLRYKSMRGYKSRDGMGNGIALPQWLYSGEDEHDLSKEMAA